MIKDDSAESAVKEAPKRRVKRSNTSSADAIEAVSSKPTTQERRRKKQHSNSGPLGFVKPDDLPGYALRIILVDHPDKPHRYFEVCESDDYTPVTYEELGAAKGQVFRDSKGNILTGPVTKLNKGSGMNMLVKKPIEFYEADLKEKTKQNLKNVESLMPKGIVDGVTYTKGSIINS